MRAEERNNLTLKLLGILQSLTVVLARVMDHQVLLKAQLRDPAWEEGCLRSATFAYRIRPREAACGSGRIYRDHPVWLLLQTCSSSITAAASTTPIAATTTSPLVAQC